jgi:hypothetical protein
MVRKKTEGNKEQRRRAARDEAAVPTPWPHSVQGREAARKR